VKLTSDIGHLTTNTTTVLTTALETLEENSALKALEHSNLLAKINRTARIFRALYFEIEVKRSLNTLMFIMVKGVFDSPNMSFETQPLLLLSPPLLLRFMYDTVQAAYYVSQKSTVNNGVLYI